MRSVGELLNATNDKAGVPHQMIVEPGHRATFLDFKTRK